MSAFVPYGNISLIFVPGVPISGEELQQFGLKSVQSFTLHAQTLQPSSKGGVRTYGTYIKKDNNYM